MTLGQFLKEARLAKRMSLRDVEKETDISNGYLSQLESDKIKQPSPIHLHKLAKLYDRDYSELMRLAGYFVAEEGQGSQPVRGVALSSKYEELTEADRKMVDQLIKHLRGLRRAESS